MNTDVYRIYRIETRSLQGVLGAAAAFKWRVYGLRPRARKAARKVHWEQALGASESLGERVALQATRPRLKRAWGSSGWWRSQSRARSCSCSRCCVLQLPPEKTLSRMSPIGSGVMLRGCPGLGALAVPMRPSACGASTRARLQMCSLLPLPIVRTARRAPAAHTSVRRELHATRSRAFAAWRRLSGRRRFLHRRRVRICRKRSGTAIARG